MKNSYRRYPGTDWENVQNFIDTWGFMPQAGHGDYSQLSDEEKAKLIDLCLDTIWRQSDDLMYSLWIENIQNLVNKVK